MKTMLFRNQVHRPGVNVTVRRGHKWRCLTQDEEIQLAAALGETPPIKARIVCTLCSAFVNIPDSILEYSNDPNCRRYNGLLEAMKKAYNDFNPAEEVTIVLYYVAKNDVASA